MHIRAYLFMMAAGILIPVILFSGLALNMLQNAERDAALNALGQSANGVALRVERELYSAEAALKVLAASPSLARQDYRAYYDEARVSSQAPTMWSVLLDAQGRQLVNTAVPYGSPLPASMSQAGVLALRDAGTTVSNLQRGARSGQLVISVNLPVSLGERRYLLRQTFSASHFNQLLRDARVQPGWLVAIIDGNGNFVARNLNAETLVGSQARPELVAAARSQHSGRIRHLTLEDTESFDVFTHSSLSGWTVAVAAPVQQIERSARAASLLAALGLLAAIVSGVMLSIFFGRQHVHSMGRAVSAAIGLGNGIPPARLHSRVLEVNELLGALHVAGEQLRQAQDYRRNAETERQALLEREQSARRMAEQQNSAKDQFLAMLGHELRNPLAPISTAAQLLKLQSDDPARVRYASEVITRQVDHMNSLLGDMLDVSRVTRGLVTLSLEQVDLRAVLERALEQTAALVDARGHRVRMALPESPVHVRGDKTRLIQIFANLLNNAAKYTPPGGDIAVAARVAAGQVDVTVQDNGEGFSRDLMPRLFDLFSQGDRQPDRKQGGLGLGLALVRSLVQLHGGSVAAASAGPGQGSSFCVTLPCSAAPQAPQCAPAAPEAKIAQRRVMVVDDNVDGATSLSLFLETAGGHHVSTCYDGAAALDQAAREAPQVFILDIGLPDMTGYELASRLQALPQCAGALLIALTGYGQAQDRERARAAGFDHHVAKPADPRDILALVDGAAE
jgi:signal transduction histidine kinase/CheY-like chemotaxis protein